MNLILLEEIVKNIFANLLVIQSDYINQNSKALQSKDFLLKEKLDFEDDEKTISNNIWGCQISSEDKELKILLGDCTVDNNFPEYCLIVQLKGAPAYGVYLVDNRLDNKEPSDPLIACTLNEKDWLICNTFLQATFLVGMEQMKEIGLAWNKCSNYKSHLDMMKSFIRYHSSYYEDNK